MFADPLSITINAIAKSLARVSTNGTSSIYQTADGIIKLGISHQNTKDRVRSVVRVDEKKIATDPLTSEQDWATLTQYHVYDRPIVGFTLAEVQQLNTGLTGFVVDAVIAKIVGGES